MSSSASTAATIALVTRFENGFNARDVDALMADMTEDTVFEHVAPPAVSFGRYEGQAAVRAVWESLDEHFPGHRWEVTDIFADGDRCACRYTLRWRLPDGGEGVGRGVDLFRIRDGKIAEKITFMTL